MVEYEASLTEFTVSTPFGVPEELRTFESPEKPLRYFSFGGASLICALDEADPLSHGFLALNPLADAVHLDVGELVRYLEYTEPDNRVRIVFQARVTDTKTGTDFQWYFMRMIGENLTTILTDIDRSETPEAKLGDLTDVVTYEKIRFLEALANPI